MIVVPDDDDEEFYCLSTCAFDDLPTTAVASFNIMENSHHDRRHGDYVAQGEM